MRVAVIVLFTERFGFAATSYAEIAAWLGALLINGIAFTVFLRAKLKENSTGKIYLFRRLKHV